MSRAPRPPTNAPKAAKKKGKTPRRGQAGGIASGQARARGDNRQIWDAYQEVRGKKGQVKALADRLELTPRRVQQIGSGPRPLPVLPEDHVQSLGATSPVNVTEDPPPHTPVTPDLDLLRRGMVEGLKRIEKHIKQLQAALNRAQPVQGDLLGHQGMTDPLQAELDALQKKLLGKK